mmetsp:Transcript_28704/g.21398  ORF Transcript_28704/g.21398 Transcript_28704/m.21398 type:complete len:115 (+) Transcript_28704:94-438(+)
MVKEPTGELITNEKYSGYLEPAYTEEWLTAFVGRPIQLLRSPNKAVPLNRKLMLHSDPSDLKKSFCSKSALHVVNESSVNSLRKKVLDKYPEEMHKDFDIGSKSLRANLIIETG